MKWKMLPPGIVLLAIILLVRFVTAQPDREATGQPSAGVSDSAAKIDQFFARRWAEEQQAPARRADDLVILRRIALALMGTIPSLEEIRLFEQDHGPDRLARWSARFLSDARFTNYFAERLARGFVGIEGGQFIVYRRDRFVSWLSEQLANNRSYRDMVREMVAGSGLWTDQPETNFVISGYVNEQGFDENKIAGRAVRAFLGQRIDCAQCHDHPFDHWKQHEFAGLASHFGQLKMTPVGIGENPDLQFEVEDRGTKEMKVVVPVVPFGANWEPSDGSRRERLAEWITHPENRRFERAIANRVWGLMFGRSWIEPVDDLPDPPGEEIAGPNVEGAKHPKAAQQSGPDLLDLLGADFREHGYDLKRLIEVILASKPFTLESRHDVEEPLELERLKANFAVFPLTRLRPEQMIGALQQSASIKTIDQEASLLPRVIKFFRTRDFVEEYGDLGERELEDRAGTIPQALLRMNGRLTQETIDSTPFTASGRISQIAKDNSQCLELCFLVCLTRRPTSEEAASLLPILEEKKTGRGNAVEDVYWVLFNSPEFAWNH